MYLLLGGSPAAAYARSLGGIAACAGMYATLPLAALPVAALTVLAAPGPRRSLPGMTVPQRAALLIPLATFPLVSARRLSPRRPTAPGGART